MNKNRISALLCLTLALAVSCKSYDDSSLWKQVDESEQQISDLKASLSQLEGQISLLVAAKQGGTITSITEKADGGVTIVYTTADGKSATAEIASPDEIKDIDIIGTKEENGVLYWTITTGGKTSVLTDKDGAKIPVSGRTPSFTTDKDGYWMVNGDYVLDASGNKVKSSGHKASLISSAVRNEDGTVTLTLADGSTFTMDTAGSFSLKVFLNSEEVSGEQKVADGVTAIEFTYQLTGTSSEGAVVNVTRTENVEAVVNSNSGVISVTVPESFRKGKFTVIAADEKGHFAARTVQLRGSFSVEMENDLWKTSESALLAPGCYYYAMDFKTLARKMKVLEIDLTNPAIEITTAIADDEIPNPNANANNNNGFILRETLSQLCARKTAAGENVIAGVNTGFFDSNDGILRGAHIENGEIQYIAAPDVVKKLTNHSWAFTVYKDGTASCEKKTFKGTVEIAGKEYTYYSVNDTIARGRNVSEMQSYPVNIYNSRYVKTPHSSRTDIVNTLSDNALYIVAKYSGDNMQVNGGWADATVTTVLDKRSAGSGETPYLTDTKEVAVQIYGSAADPVESAVKVGDTIRLKAEMVVDGEETRPILTQNSTMWHFVSDGENALYTVPASHDFRLKNDPMTFVCVDRTGARVMIVEVDGRSTISTGINAEETTEIALRLGAWNATRFDGGGSAAMWVKNDGVSGLVSVPSDSKGERSCMNYIYVRQK